MKKILKWTGIVLGGLLGLAVLAGLALYPIGLKKLTSIFSIFFLSEKMKRSVLWQDNKIS